jgi:hypothetical protein
MLKSPTQYDGFTGKDCSFATEQKLLLPSGMIPLSIFAHTGSLGDDDMPNNSSEENQKCSSIEIATIANEALRLTTTSTDRLSPTTYIGFDGYKKGQSPSRKGKGC